jgi:very-short-patch-repair endonuclease
VLTRRIPPLPRRERAASKGQPGEGEKLADLSLCIRKSLRFDDIPAANCLPILMKWDGMDERKASPGCARMLRQRQTKAERMLWRRLQNRQLARSKFRRQVPIGPYVVDFVCLAARLVIEVDGGQHAMSPTDVRRDRWFAAQGFRLLRFWNNEVLDNLDGVLQAIAEALAGQPPHPAPLPQGEREPGSRDMRHVSSPSTGEGGERKRAG